jgi:hypothetical protein
VTDPTPTPKPQRGAGIMRALMRRFGMIGHDGPSRADQVAELAKAIASDERQSDRRRARARLGYLNREAERREFTASRGAGAAKRLSSRAGSPWHDQPGFVRQVRRQRAAAIAAAQADRDRLRS